MINQRFAARKKIVRAAVIVALAVDLCLVALNWRMASQPQAPAGELQRLAEQRKIMDADVRRGDEIQKDLPAIEQQDDLFFHQQFRPLQTGYSGLVSDLAALAATAGLRTNSVTYARDAADSHGLVAVKITENVEGSYQSVVTFLNAMQRSKNFYILDSLSLNSSAQGDVKLALDLRTFFRT